MTSDLAVFDIWVRHYYATPVYQVHIYKTMVLKFIYLKIIFAKSGANNSASDRKERWFYLIAIFIFPFRIYFNVMPSKAAEVYLIIDKYHNDNSRLSTYKYDLCCSIGISRKHLWSNLEKCCRLDNPWMDKNSGPFLLHLSNCRGYDLWLICIPCILRARNVLRSRLF